MQPLTSDLRLTLGEDEYTLKCSHKAATAVSQRFDGFNNALAAIANSNLAAIQFILRQGITVKTISTDDLNEAIYEAGTRNILRVAMKYVTRLSNGGRDPDEEIGGGDEDADGEEDARGNGEV